MEFKYFNRIREILNEVEHKEDNSMGKAVDILVNTILNKKSIFVFGASHAGIITEELYYRAGGLVLINPIFAKSLMLDTSPITMTSNMERLVGYGETICKNVPMKEGDILIVHSVSGRNPVSIEIALEAKRRKVSVICITNLEYSKTVTSRHPCGKNLYEVCDIVIDNHGDIGDACVELDGLDQKVSPSSTVIAATIMNSIIAEVTQKLIDKGISKPPIFYSANIDGGDELNRNIYNEYKEAIHYKY
ncbi:SIS domain-containing protein [Clostridium sp.]|uniref:SIS domain-containing protein n=1 Tax=Clostridium sp. TaxID=1506 RepID=UPI001DAC0D35|nr:SIS domain-containing protein [Clostridium sp.]MBS5936911.1 SIS domain-containing protein [Clostridium sp.]